MGALRLGDFILPSGKRSSYDIDLRLVPSYPDIYTTVLAAYVELVERVVANGYDVIAGVAIAGLAMSSPLAIMLKKPMMYVRKHGEGRGPDRLVEGTALPGSRVLIIDDLVSSGQSLVYATSALRKNGYKVTDTAVLVDRLEGGKSRLAEVGVRLNSFASIGDLLQGLQQAKLVKKSQVEAILGHTEAGRIARTGESR